MARKVITIVIILVAVGVALVGYYLLTKRGGPTGINYKTYTNESYSFKFDYPADWNFMSRGLVGASMDSYFYAAASENTTEGGGIVMYVYNRAVYENLFENRHGISLDNLTSYISSLENRFENNENFVLIGKPTEIAIDNNHGVRYSLTALKLALIALRCQVEQVGKDNYFYDFETIASEKNYSTYEPMFQHVIDSFTLLD
jgi:hypothetical protein